VFYLWLLPSPVAILREIILCGVPNIGRRGTVRCILTRKHLFEHSYLIRVENDGSNPLRRQNGVDHFLTGSTTAEILMIGMLPHCRQMPT
jgi:hypothetical protein